MNERPLRVGLIGLGFAAAGLKMPAYRSIAGVEITAIADPSSAALAEMQRELGLGDDACYTDYRALLGRGDLDFVDVSTPHATHLEILTGAAAAGVAAICDKPLALSLAEADQAIGAAERAGTRGGVHRNFHFFPSWERVRALVEDGAIGRPSSAAISATGIWTPGAGDAEPSWRRRAALSGGGIVIDYGMHLVYLARAIMGRGQPRRVDARIAQTPLGTGDVEDVATLTLEWEDGAHAVLHLSWGDGTSGDSTIHGPGGALKISYPSGNSAPHNVATGVAQLTGRDEQLMHPLDWQRFPLTWYYGGSIASFADACAGRGDAFSFADGRDDLEVGLAAYLSSATERPVELPLPPSHPVYQYGALGVRRLELSPTSPVLRDGLFQPATS